MIDSEKITIAPPGPPENSTWWSWYRNVVAGTLSPTALEVLHDDCAYITDQGIFGDGSPGDARWPASRVRRGLVMGAVQSGKTASMVGIAAMSMDQGVDIVVVLGGTKRALWRQTYQRISQQLLSSNHAAEISPRPSSLTAEGSSLTDLYGVPRLQLRRRLQKRVPLVYVAMKNVHHIRALSEVLRERVFPNLEALCRPVHMLVLDDEADDGSVLDARVEANADSDSLELKQIPRVIVDLWESRPHTGDTAVPCLFTTYVGYTATPQANFLQSDYNPLAPSDFVAALRTPSDQGSTQIRESTYADPAGRGSFYTGGEMFYRRLPREDTCPPTSGDEADVLRDALRAFLVAGAIRGVRDGPRQGPHSARSATFASEDEARQQCPRPHSMLFHPSPAVADHFAGAEAILGVLSDGPTEQRSAIRNGQRHLPVAAIRAAIEADDRPWRTWFERYQRSAVSVDKQLGEVGGSAGQDDWAEVRQFLLDEIVPGTRIAVVNSDVEADAEPDFTPIRHDDGWSAPPEMCTIFVAGNVMSRGLTLEGLTTTLFLRHSDQPYADTQMQMQRWFGYRGSYLDLCRVFVPKPQLDLFTAYHEADEALRRTVLHRMTSGSKAPEPSVIQGERYLATGKLASLTSVPLSPGPAPFIRFVNDTTVASSASDSNTEVVARVFAHAESTEVVAAGTTRGRILDRSLSLDEAADLLDELRYSDHHPDRESWEARRWLDLEAQVGIKSGRQVPFFRPPDLSGRVPTPYSRVGCPYGIAAYLRLWSACLTRAARGLFATDDYRVPWSAVDLNLRARDQPRFHVGLRFGEAHEVAEGPLSRTGFPVTLMRRQVKDGLIASTWGSRNPGGGPGAYKGDSFFDYHHSPFDLPQASSSWRPVGSPGLLLFHAFTPSEDVSPMVAVGLAVPLGGPDQFGARGGGA